MMASVSLMASTRVAWDVASPWTMLTRGWLRSSGGSLDGLRRNAVTWCCLLRHAARAAEPTRPGRRRPVSSVFVEGCGARGARTCSADDDNLHGCVGEGCLGPKIFIDKTTTIEDYYNPWGKSRIE